MRWASNNPLVGNGTQKVTGFVPNERLETEADYGEFGTSHSTITPCALRRRHARDLAASAPPFRASSTAGPG